MKFIDLIKKRHSIRSFKEQLISEQILNELLEGANLAPSAGNLQSYEMYIATDSALKKQLSQAAWNQNFISEAPVTIVFCANLKRSSSKYGKRGEELYSVQDATIAAAYFQLAAVDLGLATVWVGAFDEFQVKKIMNLPDHIRPVALIPVGYSNESPAETPRRTLKDIVHKL